MSDIKKKHKTSPDNIIQFIKKYKNNNNGLLPSVSDVARGVGCTRANACIAVKRDVDLGILKRVKVAYSPHKRVDVCDL